MLHFKRFFENVFINVSCTTQINKIQLRTRHIETTKVNICYGFNIYLHVKSYLTGFNIRFLLVDTFFKILLTLKLVLFW